MTPLGTDRYMNKYWWTPAAPDRLYVEHTYKLKPAMMPLLAKVVLEQQGHGEEAKRDAAVAAVIARVRALPIDSIQQQLEALQPGADAGAAAASAMRKLRVRGHIIGHARNNM